MTATAFVLIAFVAAVLHFDDVGYEIPDWLQTITVVCTLVAAVLFVAAGALFLWRIAP